MTAARHFGGQLVSSVELGGLRLSEVAYGALAVCRAHRHGAAFFALLLRGRYVETMRRRTWSYRAGDLGFHPESTLHADALGSEGSRFFLVEMDPQWIVRVRECAPHSGGDVRLAGSRLAALAGRLHREHLALASRAPNLISDLVLELLAGLLPPSQTRAGERPAWLAVVIEILRSEYSRSVSLDRIAAQVGLHPIYVSRRFRELTGQNISEYLTSVRVAAARRKLAEPETRLADVAVFLGFFDQSHFTRVFKRATGTTPAAFRRSVLSGAIGGRRDA